MIVFFFLNSNFYGGGGEEERKWLLVGDKGKWGKILLPEKMRILLFIYVYILHVLPINIDTYIYHIYKHRYTQAYLHPSIHMYIRII